MLKPLLLMTSICVGAAIGWQCGQFGGLMGSYLLAVVGASIGLYIGRKIQRNLGDD